MPSFNDTATTAAPPEEVWKMLYDPSRFPDWWTGFETVEMESGDGEERRYTMYPEGYPELPMPQLLRSSRENRRVTISCLISELVFEWRLEPADAPAGTRISVHVDIPEAEAQRLEAQRDVISSSLHRLAMLAEAAR
jgi:uncharacterized protein YndB with AHSA1/START domain